MNITVMLLLSVLMNTIAQLSLKHGIVTIRGIQAQSLLSPFELRRVLTNPFVLLWAALMMPSMFLWLKAISMTELSVAYPFLSLTLVFITLGSILFLKERVTARQWMGTALILLGIVLIARSS